MCIPWGLVCVYLRLPEEIGCRKVYSAKRWTVNLLGIALVARRLYWLPVVYLEVNHLCENSYELLPSSRGIHSFGHQGSKTSTYTCMTKAFLPTITSCLVDKSLSDTWFGFWCTVPCGHCCKLNTTYTVIYSWLWNKYILLLICSSVICFHIPFILKNCWWCRTWVKFLFCHYWKTHRCKNNTQSLPTCMHYH